VIGGGGGGAPEKKRTFWRQKILFLNTRKGRQPGENKLGEEKKRETPFPASKSSRKKINWGKRRPTTSKRDPRSSVVVFFAEGKFGGKMGKEKETHHATGRERGFLSLKKGKGRPGPARGGEGGKKREGVEEKNCFLMFQEGPLYRLGKEKKLVLPEQTGKKLGKRKKESFLRIIEGYLPTLP